MSLPFAVNVLLGILLHVGAVVFLLRDDRRRLRAVWHYVDTHRKRALLALIVLALVALGVITFIRLGQVLFIIPVFLWMTSALHTRLGIDIWLGRALALLLVVPFALSAGAMLSSSPRRRAAGFFSLFILFEASFLGIFFFTDDWNFSLDGRSEQWVIVTLQGCEFSPAPGIDTYYGVRRKEVTPEILRLCDAFDAAPPPGPDDKHTFFSPITGEPVKWFARLEDGTLEVFPYPGHHPRYGVLLKPVSGEIVREYERQQAILSIPTDSPITDNTIPAAYFDILTGQPLKWYLRLPDGTLEVFPHSGYHPRFGAPLIPITREIVEEIEGLPQASDSTLSGSASPDGPPVSGTSSPSRPEVSQPATGTDQATPGATTSELEEREGNAESLSSILNTIALSHGWAPLEQWRDELSGKEVTVVYYSTATATAAQTVKRLQALGATVKYRAEKGPAGVRRWGEVRYPFDALRAATAIRSALLDLRQFDLEGTGRMGGVVVVIR